jgi:uncharacterized membrane protein YhaH (DUF805 family)
MMLAIKHGFTNLATINGRDARQAFWYWVLFLWLVTTAISLVVTVPLVTQMIAAMVEQVQNQAANPDRAGGDAAAMASISGVIQQALPTIILTSVATSILIVAFIAASLVRRLHDSDLPGWWALLPIGLQLFSMSTVPAQMERSMTMMATAGSGNPAAMAAAMQGAYGPGPLAGWGAIIVVIVLGVRESTKGPNRFGEAPFVA